ncbi:MAG: hypothetical protein F6K10_04835 [Moorea sp. SIO2B7]|nr:hypothetical protein [Moorena sp. SIO2B7]
MESFSLLMCTRFAAENPGSSVARWNGSEVPKQERPPVGADGGQESFADSFRCLRSIMAFSGLLERKWNQVLFGSNDNTYPDYCGPRPHQNF